MKAYFWYTTLSATVEKPPWPSSPALSIRAYSLKAFLPSTSNFSLSVEMKEALLEAIHVLEESRKAFKSKRLEALRKKLIQVLSETD